MPGTGVGSLAGPVPGTRSVNVRRAQSPGGTKEARKCATGRAIEVSESSS